MPPDAIREMPHQRTGKDTHREQQSKMEPNTFRIKADLFGQKQGQKGRIRLVGHPAQARDQVDPPDHRILEQ